MSQLELKTPFVTDLQAILLVPKPKRNMRPSKTLLYELRNGNSYIPHTEYEVYENYIQALERGEDASYIGEIRIVTTK